MKNKNLMESFNNAVNGIVYTIKNEKNMKIHIISAVAILIMSLIYGLDRIEFLIICITITFVLMSELFNTAVEIVVDIIVDAYHPKAKNVKDVSAGAVMVSSFFAIIVAYLIFFDRVSISLHKGIKIIKQSPIHITIIALLITIIVILSLKAFFKKGTYFQGGMPSGHSAIATSITTAVALWTNDINIIILCLVLAVLVVESRLETKIHTIFEVAVGIIIGFFITLLLFKLFMSYPFIKF